MINQSISIVHHSTAMLITKEDCNVFGEKSHFTSNRNEFKAFDKFGRGNALMFQFNESKGKIKKQWVD